MNQKKAKALRRECAGMPKMMHLMPQGSFFRIIRNRKTGEIRRVRQQPEVHVQVVNHYRNAKKLYRGSVKRAVRAAMRYSDMCEALGRFKYPSRKLFS